MSGEREVLHVRRGELERDGSWVYAWLGRTTPPVLYAGGTALPPAVRTWLHLHDPDPEVGRVATRLPTSELDHCDVLAFRLYEGADRAAVKSELIDHLAERALLAANYIGDPPGGGPADPPTAVVRGIVDAIVDYSPSDADIVTEPSSGTERATLGEFLDYQREALIGRLQGLTDEQARLTPTASSLSLLNLIKHSAIWERRWFQVIVAGRSFPGEWPEVPDVESEEVGPTFQLTDNDTIETAVEDYRKQIAASNEILDSFDLGAPCTRSDKINESVRWVAVHMIEETARHAGHADIIRETIDGTRGT